MKRIFIFVGFALCAACGGAPVQTDGPLAGADRDGRGCIASAGYVYVPVLGRCARLWEAGIRLNPAAPPKDGAVLSAFAVFAEDGAQAELFTPQGEVIRMQRSFATSSGPQWTGGGYRLVRTLQGWALYQGAKLVFSAPNPAAG